MAGCTMRLTRGLGIKAARRSFRAGDVPRLKSGGRAMTATWSGRVLFAPGTWLICQWFSEAGELQQEMFPEETLEPARDDALVA
jgi:uncharacterized protein YodC (DUF2158 family)